MNLNQGLDLPAPRLSPVLDPSFRPAILANRAFNQQVRGSHNPTPIGLALEQTDGTVSHFHAQVFALDHPKASANFIFIERLVKFLLWSRGGFRIHFNGPAPLAEKLSAHYRDTS